VKAGHKDVYIKYRRQMSIGVDSCEPAVAANPYNGVKIMKGREGSALF